MASVKQPLQYGSYASACSSQRGTSDILVLEGHFLKVVTSPRRTEKTFSEGCLVSDRNNQVTGIL